MTPRVVYWNNIPAPYMVERFNAVARRGNLDFEAWFSAPTEKGRSWTVDEDAWEFEYEYLPALKREPYPLALPSPLLRNGVPDVLVSLYAAPSFLLGWATARVRGARTAFWVEVTFDSLIRRRRWKESLKTAVFPRVDAILTAGSDGRDFAMRHGATSERIFVVPHVIDFERYSDASRLETQERERLRGELGIRGTAFLYVGRLWAGKGVGHLFDAFSTLRRTSPDDVSLVLVGDGIDEPAFRARCRDEGLDNVVFTGFHEGDMLPRLYAAGDVFVFPALGDTFGMAVSEAMACGLPVIATSATGEIADRVTDGVNGFVVPPADSSALSERMALLAGDPGLRRRMGEASRERVAGQSPDFWANAFEDAIGRILALPGKARPSAR
jgi:glycosyltransferase involved in cell wall biosynthesis